MDLQGNAKMTHIAQRGAESRLHKLERDYAKVQQDDEDIDAAYNFFATAENMPEWIKGGGRKGKAFKRAIQQQELILTLVNELMIGEPTFSSYLR
jgi:hypothetical protein